MINYKAFTLNENTNVLRKGSIDIEKEAASFAQKYTHSGDEIPVHSFRVSDAIKEFSKAKGFFTVYKRHAENDECLVPFVKELFQNLVMTKVIFVDDGMISNGGYQIWDTSSGRKLPTHKPFKTRKDAMAFFTAFSEVFKDFMDNPIRIADNNKAMKAYQELSVSLISNRASDSDIDALIMQGKKTLGS